MASNYYGCNTQEVMRQRYWIYIIFLALYFIAWGLVPLKMDPFFALTGNESRFEITLRPWYEIMFMACLGIVAIELIFIFSKKMRVKAARILLCTFFGAASCFFFFISGQNLEECWGPEYVKERVWWINIRTVVTTGNTPDSVQFLYNYKEEGCFRYYRHKDKEYKVFRGLGFAFNLSEKVH